MTRLITIWAAALSLAFSASGVEFNTVEFGGKSFIVCRVMIGKERLQLFHRDEAGQPFKRLDRLAPWLQTRGQKLVFAMNAGMYHKDFSAVGLYVDGGRQIVPLNIANREGNFFLKPNGVFAVTDKGARVVESSEYPKLKERVILATQSGPMLVHGGKIHPGFNANSQSRLPRNGVGAPSPDVALFVMSDAHVTLHEFASLFRDKLGCQEALFLDGTICSLYAPALKRSDFTMELGPMIGVTE